MFQYFKNTMTQGVWTCQKCDQTGSFNLLKISLLFRVSICQNIRKQGVSICRKNKGVSTCQKHTGTRCFNMSKNSMTQGVWTCQKCDQTGSFNLPKISSLFLVSICQTQGNCVSHEHNTHGHQHLTWDLNCEHPLGDLDLKWKLWI